MPARPSARTPRRPLPLRLERPLLYAGCLLALAGLAATGHRVAAGVGAVVVLPLLAWRVVETLRPKQRVMTWNEPRAVPRLRRRTIYGPDFPRAPAPDSAPPASP